MRTDVGSNFEIRDEEQAVFIGAYQSGDPPAECPMLFEFLPSEQYRA
jgi:hypothetical protein